MALLKLHNLAPIFLEYIPLFTKLSPFIFKLFIFFERFFPIFLSFILRRVLNSLHSEDYVSDYQIYVIRAKRLDYKIQIKIVLTMSQVNLLFDVLIKMMIKSLQK